MNKERTIFIKGANVDQYYDAARTRLSFSVEIDGAEKVLWFELDDRFSAYIVSDRCDGALVSLLYYAIRFNYEVFLECPVSEDLYYQLQYQLIPQFSTADSSFHKIQISHQDLLSPVNNTGNATGMGMSLGVDSFATLYEYNHSELSRLKNYNVTHLTYHQVGAHHGKDALAHRLYTSEELFEKDLKKVNEFCREYGFPLVAVNSNLDELLNECFPSLPFWASYSFRNAGIILLLQKLFSKFLISSGFNLNEFHVGTIWDVGRCDPFLLPLLSTSCTKFYRTNQDWNRIKKIKYISGFEPSYDHLTVCMVDSVNCGICFKCKPTLLAMDVLGVLDRYSGSFDLDRYRQENREPWLKELWSHINKENFISEVINYAIENDFSDLPEPDLEEGDNYLKFVDTVSANIRRFPHLKARILKRDVSESVQIFGEFGNWYYIKTSEGENGYIHKDRIKRVDESSPQ